MQVLTLAGRRSAETQAALADESGISQGAFLQITGTGGEVPNIAKLKTGIRVAMRQILAAESRNLATGERDRDQ